MASENLCPASRPTLSAFDRIASEPQGARTAFGIISISRRSVRGNPAGSTGRALGRQDRGAHRVVRLARPCPHLGRPVGESARPAASPPSPAACFAGSAMASRCHGRNGTRWSERRDKSTGDGPTQDPYYELLCVGPLRCASIVWKSFSPTTSHANIALKIADRSLSTPSECASSSLP